LALEGRYAEEIRRRSEIGEKKELVRKKVMARAQNPIGLVWRQLKAK